MTIELQPNACRTDIALVLNGVRSVLAQVQTEGSSVAMCLHPVPSKANHNRTCGTPLQRSADGDLADGVRLHYKAVHPDRSIQ